YALVQCGQRILFFFFSSRRRHTRSKRDWSSDVCSSDLRGGPGRPAMSSIPCPRPYGYSIPLATPMKNLWITRRTPKNVDGKCGREWGWVPGVEEWFRLPVRGRGREMGSGDAGEALVTGCSPAEDHGNPDVAIGVGYIGEEWPVWRNGAPGLGGLSSCAPRRRRAAAPSARARPLPSAP